MNQITQYDVRTYDCRFPVVIASCGGHPQVVVINCFITDGFGIGKFGIHAFQFVQCGCHAYINPVVCFLYQSVGCFQADGGGAVGGVLLIYIVGSCVRVEGITQLSFHGVLNITVGRCSTDAVRSFSA